MIQVRNSCFENEPYCPIIFHDVLSFDLVMLFFFLSMCFCLFILFYYCFISCILYVVILSSIMCCFVLSLTCVCFRVSDSLSTMTSSQAEINGMMVMVHSTLRLNFFNYGSSCQTRPITLTTLYEMMMDLTWRIELILSKYQSSSRGAPRVVMLSLPHLTSPASVTLGASQP